MDYLVYDKMSQELIYYKILQITQILGNSLRMHTITLQ